MFFTKMPKTQYDFLGTGKGTTIPNIFRQIRINDRRFDKITAYETYQVKDMRPDQVSYELYGTTDHYWTFFLINKHLQAGLNAWPKSYQVMEKEIARKYPGYSIRPWRVPGPELYGNTWNPEIDGGDDWDFNMVASRFDVGDYVYIAGDNALQPTGPYGILTGKDPITNQLFFEYAEDSNGTFSEGDDIRVGPYYVDQSTKENVDDPKLKYVLLPRPEAVHHFENSDGVSYTNYYNYQATEDAVSNITYEKDLNFQASKIRVIRKKYIDEFAVKYRQIVNG